MSFLSRLFGRRSSIQGPGDLDKRLEKLEAEAETAAAGYVGTAYNRAGDVALRGGEAGRAVEYYGQAIDAFLTDGQREAARGVANKIIRVRPGAVRTLCTLTWLDLAARHSATALLHLRDYVEAARAIDRTRIAASQIYEMARIVPEAEFIAAVADALDVLDYAYLGHEVRDWVKSKGSPEAISDPGELAEGCLQAAVKSNERGDKSIGEPGERSESTDADSESVPGEDPELRASSPDVDEDDDAIEPEREEAETQPGAVEPPSEAAKPEGEGVGGTRRKKRRRTKGRGRRRR